MTNDHILINNASAPILSKVVKLNKIDSAIIAQITGTGTLSATLKVYGGVYNEKEGTWDIRVTDFSELITGTGPVVFKKNANVVSTHVQFEVTAIAGTNAKITAALINSA